MKTNNIKTPTGRRQQVGYLQAWPRIWTRDDREQIERAGLEPGTAGLRVRRVDHPATLPPLLLKRNATSSRWFPRLSSIFLSLSCPFDVIGTEFFQRVPNLVNPSRLWKIIKYFYVSDWLKSYGPHNLLALTKFGRSVRIIWNWECKIIRRGLAPSTTRVCIP